MKMDAKIPTEEEINDRRRRRLEAMHLQEIEGNPLDEEQEAMFEMFERERWTDERIKAHLDARAKARMNRPPE